MLVFDIKGAVLGRAAAQIAKHALRGEEVRVVNAEEAIITGSKEDIVAKYRRKRELGGMRKAPHYPRMPDRLVKRVVRGMLPYKTPKGRAAYRRIRVYIGVPEEYKNVEVKHLSEGRKYSKYIKVGELSKLLGAKFEV